MKPREGPRRGRLAALAILSILAIGSRASADQIIEPLTLSSLYNSTPITFSYDDGVHSGTTTVAGGGDIADATLGGVSLPYLYCLQWNVDVYVGTTYGRSLVNNDGFIHHPAGDSSNGNLVIQPGNTATAPRESDDTAAKNVAWLIVNEAPSVGGDITGQAALQAAIWTQVTPNFALVGDPTSNLALDYKADIAALNAAGPIADGSAADYRSSVLYISPSTDADASNLNQALLGYAPGAPGIIPALATPEPATLAMALSGLVALGLVALIRRRSRASAPA